VTRAIIKAAEWTLGPETAPEAPTGVYSAVCIACGAESPATDGDPAPVEMWALRHTGLNPAHRQFKAMVETYWQVTPAEGNPYRELDAQASA
jgi:hypothetical protein